jgi:hypothetical protein
MRNFTDVLNTKYYWGDLKGIREVKHVAPIGEMKNAHTILVVKPEMEKIT